MFHIEILLSYRDSFGIGDTFWVGIDLFLVYETVNRNQDYGRGVILLAVFQVLILFSCSSKLK